MSNGLKSVSIRNYRCLADLHLPLGNVNVVFGPNGAGKSTFLDTVWFVRDCAIRGTDEAASDRSHGIGMLWEEAEPDARISISLETETVDYRIEFGFSSGRIEPYLGERLVEKELELTLIDRKPGSNQAAFYHPDMKQALTVDLIEPERLALSKYIVFYDRPTAAAEFDRLLHVVHFYHCRYAAIFAIRRHGSESGRHTYLWDRGQNLWSALRNLHDRRDFDDRYETIIHFMRKAFPDFKGLLIEQTGPNSVYGSFQQADRKNPIHASGVSDGHLQMLLHLTALFGEADRQSLLFFDEPEISLHPHAIATFAEAVHQATQQGEKQVFIASHSPVLISQFELSEIIACQRDTIGATQMRRAGEMPEMADLLEEYAAGSLYMSEVLAGQSREGIE